MVKIYKQPFAHDGDAIAIPDASQPDGKMSSADGWTPDYQLPKTDPNYKPVGRQEMNGVFKEATEAIGELQLQGGIIRWQAIEGGFNKGAIVYGADMQTLWQNTVDANTTDPDSVSATGWKRYIDIATATDITAGTAGKLVDAKGLKSAQLGAIVGEIRLLPFRTSYLPSGWRHANGDKFSVTSTTGKAIKALHEIYKLDWGIVESGGMISLPNLYHEDGRAFFMRAGSQPAVVQGDAIRNIAGTFGWWKGIEDPSASGVFSFKNQGSNPGAGHVGNTHEPGQIFTFDPSTVVPTAEENRPLNISFTPAIYLGV